VNSARRPEREIQTFLARLLVEAPPLSPERGDLLAILRDHLEAAEREPALPIDVYPLLTARQVGALCRVAQQHVSTQGSIGELPSVRIGVRSGSETLRYRSDHVIDFALKHGGLCWQQGASGRVATPAAEVPMLPLMPASDTAAALGCSSSHVLSLAKARQLAHVDLSTGGGRHRQLMFRPDLLRQFVETRTEY
jgi:hypothetical protein